MENSKLKRKEYIPSLGDIVKIKRDIDSDTVVGEIGQVVMIYDVGGRF